MTGRAGARQEPLGTLAVALAHAHRLLARDPSLAERQAREILRVVPGEAQAHALLGNALAAQQRGDEAIAALRRAAALDRDAAPTWRLLAAQLLLAGDAAGADAAHAEELRAATSDPRLHAAAAALCDNDLPVAERLLRAHLKQAPDDSAALRMLAEVGGRLGRYDDALAMLDHALAIAPGFAAARFNRALLLYRQQRPADALAELDRLLADDPGDPACNNLRGAVLSGIGDLDGALAGFEAALARRPQQPKVWMSYGHSLKTAGRQADSIAAYRRAIAQEPRLGEAWWSLANLKTVRFDDADMATMCAALARDDLTEDDRFHLDFALGKALEDGGLAEASFRHYADGNRRRRALVGYDADALTDEVARAKALFTRDFFAARAGWGSPSRDPIFVLGMPRSGSTLIEQILASHPLVEGTHELPEIRMLAARKEPRELGRYPDRLAALTSAQARALGEEYLERTRVQRRDGLPFFVDKMPNNWAHLPFIHLILPNAKIIDARRHPLACCFSNFKQHFARGQHFSYDLAELGRYYVDYVSLMAHVDETLPGRVHRVFHEALVDDAEGEIRRLLDHVGLDFAPACLRFHENRRAVRTASSEQVRRPINREGIDRWRGFEAWLGPLEEALGPVLETYPFAT